MADIQGKDYGEYLPGTEFDDFIAGNGGNDTLDGFAGDDLLLGGTGADKYYGGPGLDAVSFYDGLQGAVVNLQTNTIANDGFGNAESVFDVESVNGTQQADHITLGNNGGYASGFGGSDVLIGGSFDNQFYPGSGVDFIDGGGGSNSVRYNENSSDPGSGGVTIDLAAGYAIDNWGSKDTLIRIHNAVGSRFDDVIYGSDEINGLGGDSGNDFIDGRGGGDFLRSGAGSDTIYGGEGYDQLNGGSGADWLDGGPGHDRADYYDDSLDEAGPALQGAFVDIGAGTATDGWGGKDTLIGIEDAYGSALADTLLGDDANNILDGGAGNDVIDGRGGEDFLPGGDGDDTIDGGGGNDAIRGDNGNDLLRGGTGDDYVQAGDGDDLIEGGTGRDWLYGGPGFDTVRYAGQRADYVVCMSGGQTFVVPLRSLEGKDEVHDIEQVAFADGTFTLADLVQPDCPPDTGVLTVLGLPWAEGPNGIWTAQGDATIGIREGVENLLAVRGGSFTVAGGTLAVNGGTVSSIVDGKDRPLFAGAFSLSLQNAGGTINAGSNLFELAGLTAQLSSMQLTSTDLRLTTDLDLPGLLLAGFGLSKEVIAIDGNGPRFATGVTLDLAKYLGGGGSGLPLSLLGKIGVKSEQLQLGYNALDDRFYLKGDVSLLDYPAYEKYKGTGTVVKPVLSLSEAEIGIEDGTAYGKGEITSKDFSFGGGWGISDLKFAFDSAADKYAGSGKLGLPFEVLAGLRGTLEFGVQPDFHMTGFFIEGALVSPGLPIFATGAFLRSLGGGASNLWSETEPVIWKGSIGIDWLKAVLKLRFEGESDFENKVAGKVKGGILVDDLGLFGSAANPLGAVKFEGSGSLDWSKGLASLTLDSIDVVNTIKGSGSLSGNSALDLVSVRGKASFEIPYTKLKLQGDMTARYSGVDAAQRYAAAWATIDNPLYTLLPGAAQKLTYGLRVDIDGDFGTDDIHVFGAGEVPLYSSWIVDASIRDLMVMVSWESVATLPVQTRVVVYDDLAKTQVRKVITEADYAANGIAVIEAWSGPLGKVVYIAAPAPGLWDVEVVNPQGLGTITTTATTSLAPGSLVLGGLGTNGDLVVIDYTAAAPGGDAALLFFADADADGLDGILIGSATEQDGAGQYVWDTVGVASGRYWVYATMEDGQRVPLSVYSAQSVLVIDEDDAVPPLASAFSPADGASGVSIGEDIVVAFDEPIQRGSGSIVLKTARGAVVENFAAASSNRLTVGGNTLTINPTVDLDHSKHYVVEFPAGSIEDLAGNGYAGTSSYNFTTVAAPLTRTGSAGADALLGGRGADTLTALAGNDLLIGLAGDDTLNGGDGIDTVVFVFNRSAYSISRSGGTVTVSGLQGTDTLNAVERARFDDAWLAFDIDGNAGQTYRLYQAAFAREPDVSGLSFWIGQMDAGASLQTVSGQFIGSAEFVSKYGANPSNADFVSALYQNVLNRLPDAAGLAFWVNQLNAGTITRPEVLIGFSESTENKVNVLPAIDNGIVYQPTVSTAGTPGADQLVGTAGVDNFSSLAGRDLLIGLGGNDNLNGGADLDTAGYGGTRNQYLVVYSAGNLTVTDTSGADGIDALAEVERLAFADRNLAFDIAGNAGQTYRLYQAAFARTPDTPGLSFWIGQMDLGTALLGVAGQFISSAEFTTKYGANPTNGDFVTLLYQNVLNRLPDAGGLAFWVNQLDGGTISRPEVLIGFSESAENQMALIGVLQQGIEFLPLG